MTTTDDAIESMIDKTRQFILCFIRWSLARCERRIRNPMQNRIQTEMENKYKQEAHIMHTSPACTLKCVRTSGVRRSNRTPSHHHHQSRRMDIGNYVRFYAFRSIVAPQCARTARNTKCRAAVRWLVSFSDGQQRAAANCA